MYALSNISWKEYKEKTDWKHKPVNHVRLVKLLLDIDVILQKSADSIFIWDCECRKFVVECRGCIVDRTIGGQWVSHEYEVPFTLTKKSESVVTMTMDVGSEDVIHDISVHHSVLEQELDVEWVCEVTSVLQEIYILKLEKTFLHLEKECIELQTKNKHVKEFFRSILGGE